MMLYKITDKDDVTHGNTRWGKNVTHKIKKNKRGTRLCSDEVLHAYKDKNLALLINPTQGGYDNDTLHLWQAEGEIVAEDWGKCGCHELKTIKKLTIPKWYYSKEMRQLVQIQFAILCAKKVLKYYEKYKSDDKRPREAIKAANKCLKYQNTTNAAYAARAADAGAAACDAAACAAYAARAAACAADEIDFTKLANKAVEMIRGKQLGNDKCNLAEGEDNGE